MAERRKRGSDDESRSAVDSEPKDLRHDAQMSLDEARMVLPGIQALFGFQLIAVFSDGFERLDSAEQLAHLASILLVTIAIALIMTPAAYDRIVDEPRISRGFIRLASRVISIAMVPLMLAIAGEIYAVTSLVIDARGAAAAAAVIVALFFTSFWFGLPWLRRGRSSR